MVFICENCGKDHDGSFASGRFCNRRCSCSFSTKGKREEINIKVSRKMTGRSTNRKNNGFKLVYLRTCKICKHKFKTIVRNRNLCSAKCVQIFASRCAVETTDFSQLTKIAYQNGNKTQSGGKTKWYGYKGIKVQGTYELRTCFILDSWKEFKLIKNWSYTNDRIPYIGTDNKWHTYTLDFKVINNNDSVYYIETKGYMCDNDLLKWKAAKDMGLLLEIWFEPEIIKHEKKILGYSSI